MLSHPWDFSIYIICRNNIKTTCYTIYLSWRVTTVLRVPIDHNNVKKHNIDSAGGYVTEPLWGEALQFFYASL